MQELSALPPLTDVPAEARAAVADAAAVARTDEFTRLYEGIGLRSADTQGIGERFEASVLTPLVAAILPPEDSMIWGGPAGRMWRGLFAEQLAAATAQAGGLGIASTIDAAVASRAAANSGEEG